MNRFFHKKTARAFLLLEVLVATFILMIAIGPLLAPSAALLKQQRQIIDKIELDHAANLFYGDFISRLYSGTLSFADLGFDPNSNEAKEVLHPIDMQYLSGLCFKDKLPYEGAFKLQKIIGKPSGKGKAPFRAYKLLLTLIFTPSPPAVTLAGNPVKPSYFTYMFCYVQLNSTEEQTPNEETQDGETKNLNEAPR